MANFQVLLIVVVVVFLFVFTFHFPYKQFANLEFFSGHFMVLHSAMKFDVVLA